MVTRPDPAVASILLAWLSFVERAVDKSRMPMFRRMYFLAAGAPFIEDDISLMQTFALTLDKSKKEVQQVLQWIYKET
jgi:hypothetical protein